MGRASREKWMRRAEAYERVAFTGDANASKAYLDRFSERKLHKLIGGAKDLEAERDVEAEEAARNESQG